MKTKYSVAAALALVTVSLPAQETYQDTKLVNNELNGTARYVGMGGAMEALGADISTIRTNPAGIGLFRSGQVTVSGGLVSQAGETTMPSFGNMEIAFKGKKTNASFDQVGLVYTMPSGRNRFMNLAFSYHKNRNFDQILTAGGALDHASQNKLTALKYPIRTELNWNGVDANYAQLMAPIKDGDGKQTGMQYLDGDAYLFGQYQKGYIGEYSFNLSGNLNNRVFLGVTFGLHDVNYRSNSIYSENLVLDDVNAPTGAPAVVDPGKRAHAGTWEELRIDGAGFDMKLGVIFRPFETSPFRVGVYVHTPTWYDLTLKGASDITMSDAKGRVDQGQAATYDYKVYTPWKFGVSLGHTIGKELALGATYEYTDYGATDNRVNDGGYYDPWYGNYHEYSYGDADMNDHTKATLKKVSTVKLGLEYKPLPGFAIRLGYNYLSPMFDKNGYRDGSISSPGNAYATSTDYTNWESTGRVTAGLGYSMKKFFVDLAYQYTQTNGKFYPFMSYHSDAANPHANNIADAAKVSHKRHQLLLTLGYRF